MNWTALGIFVGLVWVGIAIELVGIAISCGLTNIAKAISQRPQYKSGACKHQSQHLGC